MNKGIANMLKDALSDLPFIEKYGGLVYLQEQPDTLFDEDTGAKKTLLKRFPVTADYTITRDGDCTQSELVDFIPDERYRGLLYFEDGGLDHLPRDGRLNRYSAKLQLICWLNTRGIVAASNQAVLNPAQLSTPLFAAINNKLDALENRSIGNFLKLKVKLLKVQPQSRNIFAQYTYDEQATQYLMPPFEYFAYSLAVEFSINPKCILELETIEISC